MAIPHGRSPGGTLAITSIVSVSTTLMSFSILTAAWVSIGDRVSRWDESLAEPPRPGGRRVDPLRGSSTSVSAFR